MSNDPIPLDDDELDHVAGGAGKPGFGLFDPNALNAMIAAGISATIAPSHSTSPFASSPMSQLLPNVSLTDTVLNAILQQARYTETTSPNNNVASDEQSRKAQEDQIQQKLAEAQAAIAAARKP